MLTRAYQHALNSSTVPVGAPLLRIEDVSLRFGGVVALSEVSITVSQGDIHAIIGPNGAGKSSLLNCVSGIYHPQDVYKRQLDRAVLAQRDRGGRVRRAGDLRRGDGEPG